MRTADPEKTQLSPPSSVSAFDHFAQPCILWLLDQMGINSSFLPLKDQQCILNPVLANKTTGEKEGHRIGVTI